MARGVSAFIAVMLLLVGPAFAADQGLAGTWAFKARGRIVFLLTLAPGPDGGAPRTGVLLRPRHMSLSGGEGVSGVELPVITERVDCSTSDPGDARLTAHDPAKPEETTAFALHQAGPDRAQLTIMGAGMAPLELVRVGSDARIDPALARPDPSGPDNPEMTRIYDADQAPRQGDFLTRDWAAISRTDVERRAQVRRLIQRGELHSATDFLHAGFIFQHGDTADDFLFAHTLALIAMAKGSGEASWLAAATLDRYLQKIGQPQVYGTQFLVQPDKSFTQDPYDRALVSDELRRLLGVPDQADQEKQRKAYGAPAKAP